MEKVEAIRIVLDTDILVDLLRNKQHVVEVVRGMERKQCLLATTVINAFELFYGAYKSRHREKNLSSGKKLLKKLVVLKMDLDSAQSSARIQAELETEGRSVGLRDAMIGAIALTRDFSLATRNVEHYRRINGLEVIHIP